MASFTQELEQVRFDPRHLPEKSTPVRDIYGSQIGTFNPHTQVIHPTTDSPYGALKLLGSLAFNLNGKYVGKFNTLGQFIPTEG